MNRRKRRFFCGKKDKTMKQTKQVIVILGGMGPQASARLVEMLIEMSTKDFGAKNGDDFPEIILDSVPVSDFISKPENIKHALEIFKERIKLLSNLNISSFAIACNTAHVMFDELRSTTKKEFVSMIDEVVDQVSKKKIAKVGLLASPLTIKFGLFDNAFQEFNVDVIMPTEREQERLEKIIRRVIGGRILESDQLNLILIADALKRRGAAGIILGCTELPLVFPKKFTIPVFNSLEILANALLLKFHRGNTIHK